MRQLEMQYIDETQGLNEAQRVNPFLASLGPMILAAFIMLPIQVDAADLAVAELDTVELVDQHGAPHEIGGSQAVYTVIDFAASWCEPCYLALPQLQALADAHPSVRVLVVSVDDEEAGRDRLVTDLDLRLPVLWDAEQTVIESFAPKAFPATYVLSPEGQVIYGHTGTGKKVWREFQKTLAGLP